MLPEISLNVLDIAQNSISAHANRIEITIRIQCELHKLYLRIADNGKGMSEEQVEQVVDPFFTSRTTRKVGLGIPFLKQSAECTGGSFSIESKVSKGTIISAVYCMDHIDCMPLGAIEDTIYTLVIMNEKIDFIFYYEVDGRSFVFDTKEIKKIMGDSSMQNKEVSAFIRSYLKENRMEVDLGQL
ncbi:MAG: ATP-binding protein [Lachnospiraceae bacterium]